VIISTRIMQRPKLPPVTRGQALATIAGVATLALPVATIGQPSAPIRIAGSLTEPYMIPYYAADLGNFARAGLNVELITEPSVVTVVEAVAGNSAEVGQGDIIMLANAIGRGLPLAIFAGGGIYSRKDSPRIALAVAKTSSYQTARDLEGQTVGVITLNSLMAVGVREWLRQNGVDLNRVKLIELLFPQMAPAIAKGLIAGAFMGEPYLSYSAVDLRILGRPYDAIAPQFYFGCWFANKEWLSDNAPLARRLTATIYDTARWVNSHSNETAVMLSTDAKLDLTWVQKIKRIGFATSLDTSLIDPVLQEAYRYKAIAKATTAQDLITRL
jgi:NitT/TauT family transport system substrate-binding protein